MTNCTDFRNTHYIKGVHVDGHGDRMFFTSDQSGIDALGRWNLYIYEGGTGRYMNMVGKMKVYDEFEFTDGKEGIYRQHAEGILSY